MDYLDNKYVIISLILLLLLFINNNTNETTNETTKETTKEIIGGGVNIGVLNVNDNDHQLSAITIHNKDINTVSTIAEFGIPFKNRYDILTFFDITINNNNPFISMYRYNCMGDFVNKYLIHSNKKRYKKIHYFSKLNLEAGDILKFVVPTSSQVTFSQAPIILITTGEIDIKTVINDKKLVDSNYTNQIISLLTNKIDVFQLLDDDGIIVKTTYNEKLK